MDWQKLTIHCALISLTIVSWKELWFRGIALDLAESQYTKIGAALPFGLLVLALHFLNPQINLIKHGLELFLAGYSLSIAYFLFGGIRAPIGIHYSNNIIGTLLSENKVDPRESHLFLHTGMLAIIAFVFTLLLVCKISSIN